MIKLGRRGRFSGRPAARTDSVMENAVQSLCTLYPRGYDLTKDFPSVSAPALSRSHRGQHNPQPVTADHADPRIRVDRPTGRLVRCPSARRACRLARRHGGAGCLRASGGEEAVRSGRAGQRQPIGPGPHDPGPGDRRPELHRAAGGRPRQPGRSGDRPAGADRPQPGHDPAEGRSPEQQRHHSATGVLDLAGRPGGRPPGRRQRRCQHDGPGLGGGLARAQTVVCHADRARVAAKSNEARCVRKESPVGHSFRA